MLDGFRHDLRYAARHLLRSPGFAAAAILTLALGVGANAAMFSMYNALVLRRLPVPDPDSLVGVTSRSAEGQLRLTLITAIPEIERDGPFRLACGYNGGGVMAADVNGTPAQTVITLVTGNCFEVFGVPPLIGRTINAGDANDQRGNPVAVVGHRFWTRMFGADPNVLGKTIRMEGIELTVIGVMPDGFVGLQADSGIDLYLPYYTISPRRPDRPAGASQILGRLKPGVRIDAASAELSARWPALMASIAPAALPDNERAQFATAAVRVEPMATGVNFYRDRYRTPVAIILALTATLLLLACLNLGGLLLARLAARGPEIGVRLALGGSRARIAQQMVIESLLLSVGGAVLAAPIALALIGIVGSFVPDPVVDRAMTFEPDVRVALVAAGGGVAAGILMSAVPVGLAWRRRGAVSFGWDRTIAGATNRWARALLVAQIALSVMMLSGAGLLIRSLYLLQHADRGIKVDGLLNVRAMPLPNAYQDIDNASYFPALHERLRAIPGVRAVAFSRIFPRVTSAPITQPIGFAGEPIGNARAALESASPEFFETIGVSLLRGRRFEWSDRATTRAVAIVSDSLARQLEPSGDVIGRLVNLGTTRNDQNVEIVGIAANASFGNARYSAVPVLYRPTLQAGLFANYPSVTVATQGDPLSVAEPVRDAIRTGGRDYAHSMATLAEVFRRAPSSERMSATLAGALAILAVAVAFIGVYGLLAYTVSRRTREIGVRVALGATRRDVMTMVIRDGLRLTAIGLALGIPLAVATGRGLRSLMFGVTETDPITLSLAAIFFLVLGVSAGMLPARRASAVDPLSALRSE